MANPGTTNAPVCSASARMDIVTAITNATATAVTGAEALDLATYAGTALVIIPLGDNVTRCYVRARLQAVSAVATSPIVQLWVGKTDPTVNNGAVPLTFAGLAGLNLWRVDTSDSDAAGITLTMPASPSDTTMVTQTRSSVEYRWSDWATNSGTGYDLMGGDFLIVPHTTAASITGTACIVEVGLLN